MLSLFVLLALADVEKVTLPAALTRASHHNLTAQEAQAAVRRAYGVVEETRATALPTLVGNGTYTHLDGSRTADGAVFQAANQLYANLTLALPLIAPSAWATWGHSHEQAVAEALNEKETRRQLALQVAQAYLAVIAEQRVVELNLRAQQTAQAHYDYTQRRLAQGMGSKLDEVRAAQELHSDASQVEGAQAALLNAQSMLGVLCGQQDPLDASDAPRFEAPTDFNAALEDAQSRRPDLQLFAKRATIGEHLVRDSWTDFMPQLLGIFQPAYQDPANVFQPKYSYQAQLVLTWAIYDGGARYGRLTERRADRDTAQLQLGERLLETRAELVVGLEAVRRAERALSEATMAADLASQAVGIADLSYKAGATTNLELIDAQRRARDAQTSAVVADDNAQKARLSLQTAAGHFP